MRTVLTASFGAKSSRACSAGRYSCQGEHNCHVTLAVVLLTGSCRCMLAPGSIFKPCPPHVQEKQAPNPEKQQRGLSLSVWRAPLRNGLFMYTSSAIYEGADTAAMRAFALDDAYRGVWDKKHVQTKRLPLEGGATSRHSCLQHYRCASSARLLRPPGPLAQSLGSLCCRVAKGRQAQCSRISVCCYDSCDGF